MARNLIPLDEMESITLNVFPAVSKGNRVDAEHLLLELIHEGKTDAERYFAYLYYGEVLMHQGRIEDAREVFTRSAQVALNSKNYLWLALSHEKLGDLSASEENWFGALHNYRYSI